MTDRIRSQHGNVIAADFGPQKSVGPIELKVSSEILYADEFVVLLRCQVGDHVWHMLGDAVTGKVFSTT